MTQPSASATSPMCERAAASCWKTGSRMAEPGSISGGRGSYRRVSIGALRGSNSRHAGTHDCRHNRWLPVDMPPADASSLRSMVWLPGPPAKEKAARGPRGAASVRG